MIISLQLELICGSYTAEVGCKFKRRYSSRRSSIGFFLNVEEEGILHKNYRLKFFYCDMAAEIPQ
jgi:hypothetical protein